MAVRPVTYSVIERAVLAVDSQSGQVLWHGQPDDAPVVSVMAVPDGEDAIVLLDYMAKRGAFSNLVRIGPDGAVRWRAQLPTSELSEAYVEADLDIRLTAASWSGHRVVLDLATGRILRSDFAK